MSLALIIIVGAILSFAIAITKDRNPAAWLVAGALFPLISVILLLLLPPNADRALAAPEA